MSKAYEWASRPPNTVERVSAGIWLVLWLFSSANIFAEWHLFGRYDGTVGGLLTLVGFMGLALLPKVKRTEADQ
ncbi:hypothetical protein [Sphingomonas sp. YR710]|uniref:hypothetical protein n=1 Tax=Sphingomonas sp. YR710 TaxID=1882773 RepID=UPI00115FF66F|nr:hypothetical protein [Sphingomonas sp. YR710]